jgi:hypothetical protein
MAMLRNRLAWVVALGFLALAGCRTAPIHDVVAAPVVSTKAQTTQSVEAAIIRAGSGLGWRMAPQGPGRMTGTLALRTHVAVVDIQFDSKTYSIKYKDSTNLDYTGNSIHKNYNGWIENLDNAIRVQLATS